MTLQNSICDLLYLFFSDTKRSSKEVEILVSMLLSCRCDFFDIANEVSRMAFPIEFDLICAVFAWTPDSIRLKNVDEKTIRSLIPRWTSTKYHSGKIEKVIKDIQEKILTKKVGLYSYHSNLSPRKTAVDDPYILLVKPTEALFFDINRRKSYLYEHPCVEEAVRFI